MGIRMGINIRRFYTKPIKCGHIFTVGSPEVVISFLPALVFALFAEWHGSVLYTVSLTGERERAFI